MSYKKHDGFGICADLSAPENMRVLNSFQDNVFPLGPYLCIPIEIRSAQGSPMLYEVIVMDHVDYFIYEIWIVEQAKSVKRFLKEINISLSEFRENFYVSVNVTHEDIAEKYIEQIFSETFHKETGNK